MRDVLDCLPIACRVLQNDLQPSCGALEVLLNECRFLPCRPQFAHCELAFALPIETGGVFQLEARGLSIEPLRHLAWQTPNVAQHLSRRLQREQNSTWFLRRSVFEHAIVFQSFQCLEREPKGLLVQSQAHKNSHCAYQQHAPFELQSIRRLEVDHATPWHLPKKVL